jgi:opacity protein-like surface antigen
MKKTLLTIIGLVILASAVNAQQFVMTSTTNVASSIQPQTWQGSNAVVVANQLLAITNADGSAVIPQNFMLGQNSMIMIRVNYTNNAPSLTASVRLIPAH